MMLIEHMRIEGKFWRSLKRQTRILYDSQEMGRSRVTVTFCVCVIDGNGVVFGSVKQETERRVPSSLAPCHLNNKQDYWYFTIPTQLPLRLVLDLKRQNKTAF